MAGSFNGVKSYLTSKSSHGEPWAMLLSAWLLGVCVAIK